MPVAYVKMKYFLALLLLTTGVRAATIIAASVSRDDVNTAVQSAAAGDTVQIPAGSANWTNGISWTVPAGVTLIGAGTSATGGGDQTVITDNYASGSPLMAFAISGTGTFRMSGITVAGGTGSSKNGGVIRFDGPGNLRIDHCHFPTASGVSVNVFIFENGVFGVMDTSILDFTDLRGLYFKNGRNGAGVNGNYEWSLPSAFGSADFFFIEDCIINGASTLPAYSARILDGYTAARVVVRFNDVINSCIWEQHATGHSSDDRGPRAMEAYGNLCTTDGLLDPNFTAVALDNGVSLVWGNSWDQVYKSIYRINVPRKNNEVYVQTATPNGWGYAGTQFNGTGSNWDGGTALATNTVYGYPCLDQPGRGMGDLLTGTFPSKVNSTTGTIRWPNQALEPLYFWNNVGGIVSGWGGAVINNQAGVDRISGDRDYYAPASGIQTSPTSPFNGTSGTGWGTLANRPTTCTTGVGYWATDQGTWNTSTSNPYGVQQNGADGVLYVATATNTWTLYYEPYTYPHPSRNPNQVQAPNFSPVAGNYGSAQSVTITSGTVGATIRYTTNGSTPSPTTGTIYSTPVNITTTTPLKAIAYNGVLDNSDVTTGVYNITGSPGDAVAATTTVTVELTLP